MIKIGLVDDHSLFRKSLSTLIHNYEGFEVVLEAEGEKQLFEKIQKVELNVLLLDIQLRDGSGYEICKIIRKRFPEMKIMMLSQLATRISLQQAIRAGAHGYFTKNSNPELLPEAIESLKDCEFYFSPQLNKLITGLFHKDISSDVCLTNRELEVIRMACKEYSSSEIADKMFINVRTVETHRKRIMEKTNSKNFLGSVLYAIRNGIIFPEEL